jgi:hypothetical protein
MAEADERHERRAEQTDKIYRALGRFVVSFSQMSFALESSNLQMLTLGFRDQGLANVAVAGLSVESLREMYFALSAEQMDLNELEQRIAKRLRDRVESLIKARNNILHVTWFVGWGSDATEDWSRAETWKIRRGTKRPRALAEKYTAERLDGLSQQCSELADLLRLFAACCSMPDTRPSRNLELVDGEVIRVTSDDWCRIK